MNAALKFLAWYIALSLIVSLLWLTPLPSWHPTSWLGWLACFVLVLPVTLALEWAGQFVQKNPISRVVETRTAGQEFSFGRVVFYLVLALLVSAAFAAVFHQFTPAS
jgi:hypothetical protein